MTSFAMFFSCACDSIGCHPHNPAMARGAAGGGEGRLRRPASDTKIAPEPFETLVPCYLYRYAKPGILRATARSRGAESPLMLTLATSPIAPSVKLSSSMGNKSPGHERISRGERVDKLL
jgi:hypothetical protein